METEADRAVAASADLSVEVAELRQTLDGVRTLHCTDAAGWCVECGFRWPCATLRAVEQPGAAAS